MAMVIQLGCAGESLSSVSWRMTRLRRLPPTICAFHLGFSLVPFPDGLVDTGKVTSNPDSRASGNDGQVKRVSGIRHIQMETVLNQSQGEMRRNMG